MNKFTFIPSPYMVVYLLALCTQTTMADISKLHALSSKQEQKLVDYLDEQFLMITGAYRKR